MSTLSSWLTGGKTGGGKESEKEDAAAIAARNELLNVIEGAPPLLVSQQVDQFAFLRSNARHKIADVVLALTAYTFSGFIHMYGQSTALTTLSMWAAGTTFFLNMQVRKVFELEDETRRKQAVIDMGLQEKNVFQLEAVASWVWMLSSLQQFKMHKRLKYCGYSSWTALCCCTYFTFRHMYQMLLEA
ncbi:hypothetical protein, conserved [Trypanosoma brucei gambiense DAL972]|uniref:Uncharacterized protein n=2 Tax=Trypanosoma brucei TaxID=5691 RepID=C9ZSL9_TRYB9|nr:hypothetical protein, conserved [Trypanosoma brucei gambiense DAL972]RHW71620.1 hypothetical protein DPX39_070041100 [Trypanosoma brucei equiperdum]CBH12403.1 hypothetical protein, conserved [Trypanosoma brucei gambiense DAL972]|eukprot:XP_011774684.1 hypothetical protein, conserved [Trypanosoma brucei gambiense DAL972]